MSSKLFIGSLPFSTDSRALEELFAQKGQVISAKVITDRDSGRSKGFGFVEMGSPEEAQDAIEAFNGYQLDGRSLSVSVAKPQEPRSPRSGGGGGGRFGGGQGGFRNRY
jgi:RNA recognition motif-containing protein